MGITFMGITGSYAHHVSLQEQVGSLVWIGLGL